MTVFLYLCPALGIPLHDVASRLGGIFYGTDPEMFTPPWFGGLLFHFVNGTFIFPLLFDIALFNTLPGPPCLRGTVFGVILWVLSSAIVVPALGGGFFFSDELNPYLMSFGSLLAHLIYGSVMGAVAGEPDVLMVPREEEKPYETCAKSHFQEARRS